MKDSITIMLRGEKPLLAHMVRCLESKDFPTVVLIENGEVKEVEALPRDHYVIFAGKERHITGVTSYTTTGTVIVTLKRDQPQNWKRDRGGLER
jgi:hypothetical protein